VADTHVRLGQIAGWAVYLGMSWTWCIGMFLPVLVMRELGLAGAIVFAIPNVLGAAAMGWLIRSPDQSRRIIGENRTACIWFSLITIVYHAYFAAWMIRKIAGPGAGVAIPVTFLIFWAVLSRKRGGNFLAAGIALAVSAGVMAWGFAKGDFPYPAQPVEGTRLAAANNFLLAPAWLFGFLCCPYLDLTFHAARQALAPRESRAAFSLGFGVIFLAMLALTVCYSGWLVIGFDPVTQRRLEFILAAHLIVQSCLTCALHLRVIGRVQSRFTTVQLAGFAAMLIVAVIAGLMIWNEVAYNGITLGEYIYRGFLGFYGLVFPSYVWLRMLEPRRSMLRVITVIVIALPLFFLGFIAEQMQFFYPGVMIVVLSKFLPDMQNTRRGEASV
jgi:hypothetical protein